MGRDILHGLHDQLDSDEKSMKVVYFAGSTYLRTTAGRTVCLRGCCSTSYRKMSASSNTSENWRTEDFVASEEYRELFDIAGEPVCVGVEKNPRAQNDAAAPGGPDDDE